MIPRRNKMINPDLIRDIWHYVLSPSCWAEDHISRFADMLKAYFGCRYIILTSSARKALELIIRAYDFPIGSEIIFPGYTVKELGIIVSSMGYVPVFVDVERDSCNMNPEEVARKISSKTALIVATHIFGVPCRIDKIIKIARTKKIKIIEDCAQSFGATFSDKKLGTFGDAGYFTFEITKTLNTFGGGCIVTDDPLLYEKTQAQVIAHRHNPARLFLKVAMSFLEDSVIHSFLFPLIGWAFYYDATSTLLGRFYRSFRRSVRARNIRYSKFQAYLGCCGLPRLERKNDILMTKYQKFLKMISGMEVLYPASKLPHKPVFFRNLVRTRYDAAAVRQEIMRRGIDVGIRDEILDNCVEKCNDNEKYPIIHELYQTLLHLPLSWHFHDEQLAHIAEIFCDVAKTFSERSADSKRNNGG
jgi:perosamine synthetase